MLLVERLGPRTRVDVDVAVPLVDGEHAAFQAEGDNDTDERAQHEGSAAVAVDELHADEAAHQLAARHGGGEPDDRLVVAHVRLLQDVARVVHDRVNPDHLLQHHQPQPQPQLAAHRPQIARRRAETRRAAARRAPRKRRVAPRSRGGHHLQVQMRVARRGHRRDALGSKRLENFVKLGLDGGFDLGLALP